MCRPRSGGPQLPWSKQVSGQKVPAGSLGWRWAKGCLCRVWWEVEGETQPWGIGVSLLSLAGRSACLLPWPLSCGQPFLLARSSALRRASGREGEAGLGEVERFIPGEQAAGESRGCQLPEPTWPRDPRSNQPSSKVEGGSFHQASRLPTGGPSSKSLLNFFCVILLSEP